MMNPPLSVTFRGTPSSEPVADLMRQELDKLAHLEPRILRCHVSLEAKPLHYAHGLRFRVLVDLSLPGRELVANREAGSDDSHDDAYQAVQAAFAAVRRQLVAKHERRASARRHRERPVLH